MSLTFDEGAKFLAIVFAGVGLFFTGFQIRANTKQRRAQYVADFLKSFWNDNDILEAYYLLEYSKFKYDLNFHDSPLERKIDRLLECFGSIAKLHQAGLISLNDISLLRYEYLVIYQNPELKSYLAMLDDWFSQRGIDRRPFDEFRSVGQRLEKAHFRLK